MKCKQNNEAISTRVCNNRISFYFAFICPCILIDGIICLYTFMSQLPIWGEYDA